MTAVYLKPKKEFVHTVFTLLFNLFIGGFCWFWAFKTTENALSVMMEPLMSEENIGITCIALQISFTIMEGDVWFPVKGEGISAVCWVGCIADFTLNFLGVLPWLRYLDRTTIPQDLYAYSMGIIPFSFIVGFLTFLIAAAGAVVLSMGPEWALRKALE